MDDDPVDESFGMFDAECAGCDSYLRVNDIGLCVDCAAKCERDLLRMRDWAYAAAAFGLSPAQRDALRNSVIRKYGTANELLAPAQGAAERHKRRGAGRQGPASGREDSTRPQDESEVLRGRIEGRTRSGFRGYPVGTVAYYGPNDQRASKVVAAIVKSEASEPDPMAKWVSGDTDARQNAQVLRQVLDFLDRHAVRSVVVTPGIYGCPHEEGLDYPEGQVCPFCPFWAGRDRDTIFRRR